MRPWFLSVLICSWPAAADTVVLRDGSILSGEASRTGKTIQVAGKSVDAAEILLWEDAAGVPRHVASFPHQLKAYRWMAERAILDRCRDLFGRATHAAAARALLERAERAGLEPRAAEAWEKRIAGLKEGGGRKPQVPGRAVLVDLTADRARKSYAGGREDEGLKLLRVALSYDAKHQGALELLREVAPSRWKIAQVPGTELTDAARRNWLAWRLDVLPGRVRVLKRRHPDLERARATWLGKKPHGVETNEIVFITSMKRSSIVGMCLKFARLTCTALDRMFETQDPRRTSDELPLVIYFYENQRDYLRLSGVGMGRGPNPGLGLTAGHYSPSENISRFFWPTRPDAMRSVRDTFVHELTHHWIQRRCPRWHARDMKRTAMSPGYWIVEGFAVFIQEGQYDIEKGTWTHFDSHAHTLDVVSALSRDRKLIAWKKVYPLTQAAFHTSLKKTFDYARYRGKWRMWPVPISEIVLFYQQSGATCHFLYWGESGKYRERLKDYVTAFYTGDTSMTSIEKAFGLTPEELGAKVEAFARKVRDGWRPE